MVEPLISVGIACYNHEKYLDDFFKSLLALDYCNIELVIVDDASTDNSVKIIQSWLKIAQKKFPNIYFFAHEKNCGVSYTCNELVRKSSGKYYFAIATDDMFCPESLRTLVKYFEEDDKLMICHADAYRIPDEFCYGDSVSGEIHKYNSHKWIEYPTGEQCFDEFMEYGCICTPSVMFRKSIFDKLIFDESINNEDYPFFVEAAKNNFQFRYINEPLMLYRVSENGLSNYNEGDRERKCLLAIEEMDLIYNKWNGEYHGKKHRKIKQIFAQRILSIAAACNCRKIFIKRFWGFILNGVLFDFKDLQSWSKWFLYPVYTKCVRRKKC